MKKLVIVIADDDEAVRDSLATLLDSHGLKTLAYGTGEEFLENCDFDENICVLLDYLLPGQTGIEIIKCLSERNISAPVIMISGQMNERIKKRALKTGAFAVLDKPLNHDLLLETIEKASRAATTKKNGV